MEVEVKAAARDDVLGGLEARARAAEGNLAAMCGVLEEKLTALRARKAEDGLGSDLDKVIREVSRALTLVMETEGKVADARRDDQGGDGLDLDAARTEVCRRLDLRAGAG